MRSHLGNALLISNESLPLHSTAAAMGNRCGPRWKSLNSPEIHRRIDFEHFVGEVVQGSTLVRTPVAISSTIYYSLVVPYLLSFKGVATVPTRYGERYTLKYSLAAVQGTARDTGGSITRIPEGSTIEIDGNLNDSGMVVVQWQSNIYQVFEADILDKGRKIEVAGS